MSKTTTTRTESSELTSLSSEDLALWAAVITVIGDLFGLFAVIKARSEK